MRKILRAFVPLVAIGCGGVTHPAGHATPAEARVVTSDIPVFWAAFDQVTSGSDTAPLRAYIDRGSAGLADFTDLRWKNSRTLTQRVWALRDYYASVRPTTLAVAPMEAAIRATFAVADTLIDHATFPDVYLAIGAMSTGGTTSAHGLLIGTEMYSRAPGSPVNALSPWQRSVIRGNDVLPAIVAHELVHYQQTYSGQTLLARSIREGSADFIGKMLSGRVINDSIQAYGLAHEAELWAEFRKAMDGKDYSAWLYNGGSMTGTSSRPADLGYFIGARIAESYYDRATDKHAAIQQILHIRDVHEFLRRSGYQQSHAQ